MTPHYRRERGGRTTTVRLTKKLARILNDVDLSQVVVGDVLTLSPRDARMLIAEGWATPYRINAQPVQAADRGEAMVAVEPPVPDESLLDDCTLADAARLNMMFIGPRAATRRIVATMAHRFETPVIDATPRRPLTRRPPDDIRTLIVHDIGRLSPSEQRLLLDWVEQTTTPPRIISTAQEPLVSAVAKQTFLGPLYYRLNTVYFELRSSRLSR